MMFDQCLNECNKHESEMFNKEDVSNMRSYNCEFYCSRLTDQSRSLNRNPLSVQVKFSLILDFYRYRIKDRMIKPIQVFGLRLKIETDLLVV